MRINANQNYYIQVNPETIGTGVPYTFTFSIDTNLVDDVYESNNSFETAYTLLTDSIHSLIGFDDDMMDYYKFLTTDVGTFQLQYELHKGIQGGYGEFVGITIYNSEKEIVKSISSYETRTSYTSSLIGTTAGQVFYIKTIPDNGEAVADYSLKIISTVQQISSVLAPTVPSPLNIKNNETYILPGDTTLSWLCTHPENKPITYNFYYGKTSPPPLVAKGLTNNEYEIENINWNDTVYWQVNAFVQPSDSVCSPIYQFSSRYISKSSISFTGLGSASNDWGDFDDDGDLDLLVTGTSDGVATGVQTLIYRNNGSELLGFNAISTNNIPGVYLGNATWGDFDNDNDLDILISGTTDGSATGALTRIYKNNGDTSFTDIIAGLPGLIKGHAQWADYNNDGLLDFILTGTLDGNSSGVVTLIYKNNGNGSFSNSNIELTGLYYSHVAWGDYNTDGYLDLLLIGTSASEGYNTILYENNKNGTFTEVDAGLRNVTSGSVAWGDYDNDGDLDILLAGKTGYSSGYSYVYRNNLPKGVGFTDIATELAGARYANTAWGDYNNDGYSDIILSGYDNDNLKLTKLYKNNKNHTFTDINADINKSYYGPVSWADFDNDKDIDLLKITTTESEIYINNIDKKNTAPSAPTNLFSTITNNGLLLGWNKSTDNETDSLGLSYNLAIFDSNNQLLNAPMSNISSGSEALHSNSIKRIPN